MAKRVTRTFDVQSHKRFSQAETVVDYFFPRDKYEPHAAHGLDDEIHLGHTDLKKLDYPKAVRVTITKLY